MPHHSSFSFFFENQSIRTIYVPSLHLTESVKKHQQLKISMKCPVLA